MCAVPRTGIVGFKRHRAFRAKSLGVASPRPRGNSPSSPQSPQTVLWVVAAFRTARVTQNTIHALSSIPQMAIRVTFKMG